MEKTGKMPVLLRFHERAERCAPMRATLIVVAGKASKGQVSLDLPVVIGRSRSADLTVAHPMISRRHCEIYDSSGLLMVRDLDSLNGTLVAGRKISEAALRPDDEFTVGPLTFRVNYEYSAEIEGSGEPLPVATSPKKPRLKIIGGDELDEPSPPPNMPPSIPHHTPPGIPPIPPELEETLPDDDGSEIAPREGQLPDLAQSPDQLEEPGEGEDPEDEKATAPVDPPLDNDATGDFRSSGQS